MRYLKQFPFTLQYWMSINYTYEGNMMFVHIKSSLYYRYNLSRTHFGRLIRNLYIVHFHSTVLDVYYLHLWKQYDVFVHIKSYLYYRYNLSRTQLWDWWGILTLFPFTLQYWMSINYTYEGNMMFVHIKSSLYYRFDLSIRILWK